MLSSIISGLKLFIYLFYPPSPPPTYWFYNDKFLVHCTFHTEKGISGYLHFKAIVGTFPCVFSTIYVYWNIG